MTLFSFTDHKGRTHVINDFDIDDLIRSRLRGETWVQVRENTMSDWKLRLLRRSDEYYTAIGRFFHYNYKRVPVGLNRTFGIDNEGVERVHKSYA